MAAQAAGEGTSFPVLHQIDAIALSCFPPEQREVAPFLLQKHISVFSVHDQDLGCANLISHDIPLIVDVPIRQHQRRMPPSRLAGGASHL